MNISVILHITYMYVTLHSIHIIYSYNYNIDVITMGGGIHKWGMNNL